MKGGRSYIISFDAFSLATVSRYIERFELKFGNAPTVDAMTTEVIGRTEIQAGSNQTFTDTVSVAADGIYNFGFHAVSDSYRDRLYIDNLRVKVQPLPTSPAVADVMSVSPDRSGKLATAVELTLPTKTIDGNALSRIDRAVLDRDGEVLRTYDNPAPGLTDSFADEDLSYGYHTYHLNTYVGDEAGDETTVKVFVGLDVPQAPANVVVHDNGNNVLVSWDAVSEQGVTGEYVNLDSVRYEILKYNASTNLTEVVAVTEPGATSWIDNVNPSEGNPAIYQCTVRAKVDAGTGEGTQSSFLIIGSSASLPYDESVSGGALHSFWWKMNFASSYFDFVKTQSSDDDYGSFYYTQRLIGDSAMVGTQRISLAGATNPKLAFDVLPNSSMGQLKVMVQRPDGGVMNLKTINLQGMSNEWATQKIELSDELKQYPYVIFLFEGISSSNWQGLYFDNIRIHDMLDGDLAVSLTAPDFVYKGEAVPVAVTVANEGDNDAQTYQLKVTVNGEVLTDSVVSEPLASLAKKTFAIEYPTNRFDDVETADFKVAVTLDGDKLSTNDIAVCSVKMLASTAPAVENLKAVPDGQDVILSWDEPVRVNEEVTEDFEDYAAFSTRFGDWSLRDLDNGYAGQFWTTQRYPVQDTQFAFTIFNPEACFDGCLAANPEMTPHSGDQYAASMFQNSTAGGYSRVQSNNWLISPSLPGVEQTISFWAHNYPARYENFDVAYSTTGTDPEDFTVISQHNVYLGQWEQITAHLPEGATHFAIHQYSGAYTAFLLGIDDVSFIAGYSAPVSYRIYLEQELIATVDASQLSYAVQSMDVMLKTAAASVSDPTYYVSAVYVDGKESVPVPVKVDTATGVVDIRSGNQLIEFPQDVYTIDGRLVKRQAQSVDDLPAGVYIVGNKKVMKHD